MCLLGFPSPDLHGVQDPNPPRDVPQRLDRHAVADKQVRPHTLAQMHVGIHARKSLI